MVGRVEGGVESEGKDSKAQGSHDAGAYDDLGGQDHPLDVQKAGLLRHVADAVLVPCNVAQPTCKAQD